MKPTLSLCALFLASTFLQAQGVTYDGKDGHGQGKNVVLIAGDEEYRSEELLPQLGKILAASRLQVHLPIFH